MKASKLLLLGIRFILLIALISVLSGSALGAGDEDRPHLNSDIGKSAVLVIGAPFEDVGAEKDAGGVNVLYSSSGGFSTTASQWFDQNTPGTPGSSEADDWFGFSLAGGDLNGDGYTDLVIGVPKEVVKAEVEAGGVDILYGSPAGLSTTGSQWFDQNTPGTPGSAEAYDWFGGALAAGDLNGDGYADLVVGVPSEDVLSVYDAGGVDVLYGSASGLSTIGCQWLDQNSPGIIGSAEIGDWFGGALAAGDLNGDGYDDLVVGVPHEDVGSAITAGGVNVLYGSLNGLSTAGSQWFDQNTPGVSGTAETEDYFGNSLAVGDLNGDGYADLAIGVPQEGIDAVSEAGGMNVLYGSSSGLTTAGSQWFDQNTSGVIGSAEKYDHFGHSLAVGDLNGDGYADLAVGVLYESVGTIGNAGGVNVLYGSSSGLSTIGNQWFDQNHSGISGSAETNDQFGATLAVGDLNRDGYADLVVGVPHEGIDSVGDAGGVHVLYGSSSGLSTSGSLWFDQNTSGVIGSAEAGDGLGRALVILAVPEHIIYLPLVSR
ncbi:MAG: FG-GAP-like repeat-containing protein [Anaerolineales bacterium]